MYYCICLGSTSCSCQFSWFLCDTHICTDIPMNPFGCKVSVWARVSGNLWMAVLPWSWCVACLCLSVLFLGRSEGWVHREACKALLWAMTAVWAKGLAHSVVPWRILMKLFVCLEKVKEINRAMLWGNLNWKGFILLNFNSLDYWDLRFLCFKLHVVVVLLV